MIIILDSEYSSDPIATNYRPLDWQRKGLMKTSTGYGTKIPTTQTVNFEGRERRIYADCYSNAPHCYIIVKGRKVTVS